MMLKLQYYGFMKLLKLSIGNTFTRTRYPKLLHYINIRQIFTNFKTQASKQYIKKSNILNCYKINEKYNNACHYLSSESNRTSSSSSDEEDINLDDLSEIDDEEIEKLGKKLEEYESSKIKNKNHEGMILGLDIPYPRLDPEYDQYIFRDMKNADEIEIALYKMWDRLTMREIDAAFNALKRIEGIVPETLLHELSHQTITSSDEITPRHVSSIFHACARLRYFNVDLFTFLAKETHDKIKYFRNLHIGMIIYSLGILQRDYVRMYSNPLVSHQELFPLQKTIIKELCNQFLNLKNERGLSCQSCGNIMYGLAMLKHNIKCMFVKFDVEGVFVRRDEAMINVIASEASRYERLRNFNEQEFANMIYGFGILQVRHESLLASFCSRLKSPALLKQFKVQGLSNVIYGFALLNYIPPKETLYAIVWEICKEERVIEYTNQHLVNIIHGLAVIGIKSFNVYKVLFAELFKRRRKFKFFTFALSSVVYSLAKIDVYFEDIKVILKDLTSDDILHTLSTQSISNLLYSFSKYPYDSELLIYFTKLIKEAVKADNLSLYTEQNYANILYGISVSSFWTKVNPSYISYLVEGATSPRILKTLTDQGLANVCYGLSKLKIVDVDVNSRLSKEYIIRLPKLELIPLTTVVYAWSLIQYRNTEALKSIEHELLKEDKLNNANANANANASEWILSNLLLAFIRLGIQNKHLYNKITKLIQNDVIWEKFQFSMDNRALAELLLCKHLDNDFKKKVEICLAAYHAKWGDENRSPSSPTANQMNALQNLNDR